MKTAGKTGRVILLGISAMLAFMISSSCKRQQHNTKYGPPSDYQNGDQPVTKYGVPADLYQDSTGTQTKYGVPTD